MHKISIIDKVRPYNTAGSKKQEVQQMFDKIAPHYDLLNRVLSLGIDKRWRATMIKQIMAHNPSKILDVATGTADVAVALANKSDALQVEGIDIAQKMLDIGDQKILKKNLDQQITLSQGDAENIPFDDGSFDIVTASFGVRNFENLLAGLKEMNRVCESNGKVYILEFSRPRSFPFKQIYNSYFKYILPVIGRLTSKDARAYSYLYESVQAFPDYERFLDVLEQSGWENPRFQTLTLGICCIYSATKA